MRTEKCQCPPGFLAPVEESGLPVFPVVPVIPLCPGYAALGSPACAAHAHHALAGLVGVPGNLLAGKHAAEEIGAPPIAADGLPVLVPLLPAFPVLLVVPDIVPDIVAVLPVRFVLPGRGWHENFTAGIDDDLVLGRGRVDR